MKHCVNCLTPLCVIKIGMFTISKCPKCKKESILNRSRSDRSKEKAR